MANKVCILCFYNFLLFLQITILMKGLTHRARIPNWANIQIADCVKNETKCEYTLNMKSGYFKVEFQDENKYRIIQLVYPHRFHNRAIVNQFFVTRLKFHGKLEKYLKIIPRLHDLFIFFVCYNFHLGEFSFHLLIPTYSKCLNFDVIYN